MEEQLKARLIGAIVLVMIAVLLIPELLSGRKAATVTAPATETARGTRTYTIDLGGAVAAGARLPQPEPARPAPAASKDTVATESAEPAASASTPQEPPEVARAEPADAPRPTPSPATSPAVSAAKTTGATTVAPASTTIAPRPVAVASGPRTGWSVQVGAFGSAASAEKLVGTLRQEGYSAYIAPLQRSGKTLHRVRIGPEATRSAADKLASRLKGQDMPATVVAND